MKKIIQFKLKILSKIIVRRYKPQIVGITGSVGKTSTKEAIYTVLRAKYNTRKSFKNYNNELGVPLTIIGEEAQGRSIPGWIRVFLKAVGLIIFKKKDYPRVLVLEMGVDKPGDMDYLSDIVTCDIGVVTAIGTSHLQFFKSTKKIQKEKGVLIERLNRKGWAVLNYDDEKVRELADKSYARVLNYGFKDDADIKAQNIFFNFEKEEGVMSLQGISFKMNYSGSVVPVRLPNVLGYSVIYSALAAAAVGVAFDMNLVEISKALKDYQSPPGRMKLVDGVKNTMIIDDTYNSSPQSCHIALDFLDKIPAGSGGRKFAVLGDMLELGRYTEEAHKEVGKRVASSSVDKLIVVGERARDIAHGAQEAGMAKENIFHFSHNREAGKFIEERLEEGDLILAKGSQGARMEKIVKEIMADPLQAKDLLVRQGAEWE
jgi:UDP-N-acetylmuramoyl-tripeptide--D-alanyl-D-alanine ligase